MKDKLSKIDSKINAIDCTVKQLEEQQDKFMSIHGSMNDSNYYQIQNLMNEREKLCEERTEIEKNMFDNNESDMILVRCINDNVGAWISRVLFMGKTYYLDSNTYCNINGAQFAEVYNDKERKSFVGRLRVEYFEELMVI